MDHQPNFFLCDELASILEDMYDECVSKKEDMYRQIALIHLLVGYPNKYHNYNKENIKINSFILKYQPIIEKFKKKWKL